MVTLLPLLATEVDTSVLVAVLRRSGLCLDRGWLRGWFRRWLRLAHGLRLLAPADVLERQDLAGCRLRRSPYPESEVPGDASTPRFAHEVSVARPAPFGRCPQLVHQRRSTAGRLGQADVRSHAAGDHGIALVCGVLVAHRCGR